MAGTTNPLAFPYPTGTDRVMDGDNAIQALAEALNTNLVGTIQTPTLAAQLTNNATRYARRGTTGFFSVSAQATTAIAPPFLMTTIPVGFRPVFTWYSTMMTYEDRTLLLVEVQATGSVMIQNPVANGVRIFGSIAYPLA
jgi:hypothetical protein